MTHSCLARYKPIHLTHNKQFIGFFQLSEVEKGELVKLYKTSSNSIVRTRSLSLLYSNKGRSIKEVSELVHMSRRSIERLLNSCESSSHKFCVLSIASGRGANIKLDPIKELLPEIIEQHSRNLNPILEELASKHNIEVCKLALQNFIKDLGL